MLYLINLDFIRPGESTLSPGESTFALDESTRKSGETSSGEWVIGRNDLLPVTSSNRKHRKPLKRSRSGGFDFNRGIIKDIVVL